MGDNNGKIIYEFPQGIINWYPLNKGSRVLFVYQGNSTVADLLMKRDVKFIVASADEIKTNEFLQNFKESFDYVIAIRVVESLEKPVDFLTLLHKLSSEHGVLLLGTENRLGIRYFLGDTDPFTGCVFDGVDNYREITEEQRRHLRGRCYTKAEISGFLRESGWDRMKVYSVMPTLDAPQLIYADSFAPEEELANRYFPRYNSVDTIFAREENILTDLIHNGMFHGMANALLFECALDNNFCKADQVTLSMDRGHEDAMSTILYRGDRVEKRALFPEGMARLESLADHMDKLSEYNIPVIKGSLTEKDTYVMPFSEGKLANIYLQELLSRDIPLFLRKMDRYRELIMQSSVKIREDEELGAIYAHGYLDMMPINCFYVNDDFYFFDQEFVVEEYPVDAILYRAIAAIYQGQPQLEAMYPMRDLWTRYHLTDKWQKLDQYARNFTEGLTNQRELRSFNEKSYREDSVLKDNRRRMNYAEKEFEQMFYNPFVGIEGKKLFLFGTGRYADKFISMYHRDYEIEGLLDNNSSKWGTELNGYPIFPPEKLYELNPGEYKVIICIKDFEAVAEQLKAMGAVHVSAFENHKVYPGRQASILYRDTIKQQGIKKYKVGYVAGVFDLFHLGHLNMFRRAKEQCEYLIVGVVTDEGVRKFKQKEPYVPFEERIEIVRSCRYVDEAVEIPYIYRTTKEAFEKYHFDVQFSGSDYENNPEWISTKKYLEENGSELVFFPYTQQTSSTQIKTLIDKGLL